MAKGGGKRVGEKVLKGVCVVPRLQSQEWNQKQDSNIMILEQRSKSLLGGAMAG